MAFLRCLVIILIQALHFAASGPEVSTISLTESEASKLGHQGNDPGRAGVNAETPKKDSEKTNENKAMAFNKGDKEGQSSDVPDFPFWGVIIILIVIATILFIIVIVINIVKKRRDKKKKNDQQQEDEEIKVTVQDSKVVVQDTRSNSSSLRIDDSEFVEANTSVHDENSSEQKEQPSSMYESSLDIKDNPSWLYNTKADIKEIKLIHQNSMVKPQCTVSALMKV